MEWEPDLTKASTAGDNGTSGVETYRIWHNYGLAVQVKLYSRY